MQVLLEQVPTYLLESSRYLYIQWCGMYIGNIFFSNINIMCNNIVHYANRSQSIGHTMTFLFSKKQPSGKSIFNVDCQKKTYCFDFFISLCCIHLINTLLTKRLYFLHDGYKSNRTVAFFSHGQTIHAHASKCKANEHNDS